ncbi:MAG: hypothetical protein ABTA16_03400 [Niallia sp.]
MRRMQNKGTIVCSNCEKEIKWVKLVRNKMSAASYEVTTINDDESVVNNNGEVRCKNKNCDTLNKVE